MPQCTDAEAEWRLKAYCQQPDRRKTKARASAAKHSYVKPLPAVERAVAADGLYTIPGIYTG